MFASGDISILIANIKSGYMFFVFKSRCHTTKITSCKLICSSIEHASNVVLESNTSTKTKINQKFEKWTEMHKFMILLLQMKTHFSNEAFTCGISFYYML